MKPKVHNGAKLIPRHVSFLGSVEKQLHRRYKDITGVSSLNFLNLSDKDSAIHTFNSSIIERMDFGPFMLSIQRSLYNGRYCLGEKERHILNFIINQKEILLHINGTLYRMDLTI